MKTAYLDHNILDFFYKNPGTDFQKNITAHREVFFSEENLNEIERCGDHAADYAALFDSLNPQYLRLEFDSSGLLSDEVVLRPFPVSGCLKIRKRLVPNYADINKGLGKSLLKSLGGFQAKSVEEVHGEKVKAYRDLAKATGKNPDHYNEEMNTSLEETRSFLNQHQGYVGAITIRESAGVSPSILNNLRGPNIVEQIWELVSASPYAKENEITFDRFFGLEHIPRNSSGQRSLITQVNMLYLMLNAIGYQTDKEWLKEDRFVAAYSDGKHVSYGIFADEFLSMDKRLCDKARAVYRHFGIATDVVHLKKE
jgi:hypothetical protein